MTTTKLFDESDPLRHINKIKGGYWVRFSSMNKAFFQQSFNAEKYGSLERALIKAQIWRDAREQDIKKRGLMYYYPSQYWGDARTCYIVGLNWVEVVHMGYLTTFLKSFTSHPLNKSYPARTYSVKRKGLKGAFNLAVRHLQEQKLVIYPDNVIKKAWRTTLAHHNQFSVNDQLEGKLFYQADQDVLISAKTGEVIL